MKQYSKTVFLLFLSFITLISMSKAEQESNLEKAIRYSKSSNERDREAYEGYVKLYRFRLANGTSGTIAQDLDKSIRSCFSGYYESKDIKHLCSALAVDAQTKKLDLT